MDTSKRKLPKACIYKQIISVVSSINDDNLLISIVVLWIITDDLEIDADILEFGWRLFEVCVYGWIGLLCSFFAALDDRFHRVKGKRGGFTVSS